MNKCLTKNIMRSVSLPSDAVIEAAHDLMTHIHPADEADFPSLREHYLENRRLCKEALRSYKLKRGLLVHRETGEVLSTRNINTYRLMDPCLYSAESRTFQQVMKDRMKILAGQNVTKE